MYEALRAGPQWEETAFIITYDEHGGFYDHVVPPQVDVPRPDDRTAKSGFEFNRLGVRVPHIVVSPWISKNTLVNSPPEAQKPTPSSAYELNSILSTMKLIFNL